MINRIYITIWGLLFLLAGCKNPSTTEKDNSQLKDNFQISGIIKNAENIPLYIEALTPKGVVKIAQTTVDQKAHFRMNGNIPGLGIYQLRLGESPDNIIPLTMTPDEKIQLNTSFSEFTYSPNVSGVDWAVPMNHYLTLMKRFIEKQQQLGMNKAGISDEEILKQMSIIKKPLDDFSVQFLSRNPDNPFNMILLSAVIPMNGFESWNPDNLRILKNVLSNYQRRYKDSPITKSMADQVFQIESAYQEFLVAAKPESNNTKTISNKMKVPEIALKNPSGKVLKLSSLLGKVVLIDFWASWCGPCRKESPSMVRIYQKFKNKNFEIFSVSLDEDKEAWTSAITQDQLGWKYHVSELKGWQSSVVQLYGFNSIPHTVLIDTEGNLVQVGLRGAALESKINELILKK